MDFIKGWGVPPWLVGAVRGLIEAAVMAVLLGIAVMLGDATWVQEHLPPQLIPYVGVAILLVRSLEGVADNIDPSKHRANSEAIDKQEPQVPPEPPKNG